MSYAVRDDGAGFRAVDSEEDLLPGEHYSLVPPVELLPPPMSADEMREAVFAERDRLLALAAIRIAPLEDALDLGDASAAEEQLLITWKRYRVAVNRAEQQAGFPADIEWPPLPAA